MWMPTAPSKRKALIPGARRDAAITRLEAAVALQALTALIGASDNGKSSVVLAGLAPRTMQRYVDVQRLLIIGIVEAGGSTIGSCVPIGAAE
jgi:Novel STAND NTPase 1